MTTLHVHLDESGNFVFSPKGSKYYIFTAVWTYNPIPLAAQLSRLRFSLIKDEKFRGGILDDLSGFHACDDPPPRRLSVINKLVAFQEWNFASLVVEKRCLIDTLYDPEKLYPKLLNMVLKFVLKGRIRPTTKRVLVYTDSLPMKSKKEAEVVSNSIRPLADFIDQISTSPLCTIRPTAITGFRSPTIVHGQ